MLKFHLYVSQLYKDRQDTKSRALEYETSQIFVEEYFNADVKCKIVIRITGASQITRG